MPQYLGPFATPKEMDKNEGVGKNFDSMRYNRIPSPPAKDGVDVSIPGQKCDAPVDSISRQDLLHLGGLITYWGGRRGEVGAVFTGTKSAPVIWYREFSSGTRSFDLVCVSPRDWLFSMFSRSLP